MNVSWLTLRDLEYLVAVADQRHFGRAAEACHVSQPSLSAQIKKLEERFEAALFERSSRQVRITPLGEAIVAQARVVLDEAKKLDELAHLRQGPLTGPFRLGVIATLGPYLMPHLLRPLKKAYPKLELLLKEGLTDGLISELRAGKLDAVLASPTFDEGGLRRRTLFFEPFLVATPKDHPLAAKSPLRASDLRADDMVLLEDGHCLKDQALEFCPAKHRGSVHRFQATSLETLRHLVASGLGYTLVPALATRDDARLKGLLDYRPLDGRNIGRTIALYSRGRTQPGDDAHSFATFVREHLPETVTKT